MIHYNPIPDSYYHPALWREQEPETHICANCEDLFTNGIQVQKEEKFCQQCVDGNLHLVYYRDVLEVDAADIYRITTEEVTTL